MTTKTKQQQDEEIVSFFSDPERVRQDIQEGIRSELKKHKLAGNAICEWKNDKVHWIPAEQINVR